MRDKKAVISVPHTGTSEQQGSLDIDNPVWRPAAENRNKAPADPLSTQIVTTYYVIDITLVVLKTTLRISSSGRYC